MELPGQLKTLNHLEMMLVTLIVWFIFPLQRLVQLGTSFSFVKVGTIRHGKFSFYVLSFMFLHGLLLR